MHIKNLHPILLSEIFKKCVKNKLCTKSERKFEVKSLCRLGVSTRKLKGGKTCLFAMNNNATFIKKVIKHNLKITVVINQHQISFKVVF